MKKAYKNIYQKSIPKYHHNGLALMPILHFGQPDFPYSFFLKKDVRHRPLHSVPQFGQLKVYLPGRFSKPADCLATQSASKKSIVFLSYIIGFSCFFLKIWYIDFTPCNYRLYTEIMPSHKFVLCGDIFLLDL